MPTLPGGTVPLYPSGGNSAATQAYVAVAAAWVNTGTAGFTGVNDYLVQPGLVVMGTADPALLANPSLFVPLQVLKGP